MKSSSKELDTTSFGSFVSVVVIILCLFMLVFFHMEIRRVGYTVLTLTQQQRKLMDDQRLKSVNLARVTGPERLQSVVSSKLPLRKATAGQIIQMTDKGSVEGL
jgi:hypothetical protein